MAGFCEPDCVQKTDSPWGEPQLPADEFIADAMQSDEGANQVQWDDERQLCHPATQSVVGAEPVPGVGNNVVETRPDPARPISGPTDMESEVGSYLVVPDGFKGPVPPGAIPQSRFVQMTQVYRSIEAGKSSHLKMILPDRAEWMEPKKTSEERSAEAAYDQETKAKALETFRDMLRTPEGLTLLQTLDAGGDNDATTRLYLNIPEFEGEERPDNDCFDSRNQPVRETNGIGCGSDVAWNQSTILRDDMQAKDADGTSPPQWAAKIGLIHELIHAYHGVTGTVAVEDPELEVESLDLVRKNSLWNPDRDVLPNISEEFKTIGLRDYSSEPITENGFRRSLGWGSRDNYSGLK